MTAGDNGRLLANSPLFADLDDKALSALGEHAVRRPLKKGRAIFYQGDPGDTLFVIAEGLVKVWVSSGDGSEMVLATLRPPESFGAFRGEWSRSFRVCNHSGADRARIA